MKKVLFTIAAVAMLMGLKVGGAAAADVTITLNDQEQKAFIQLLDLAAKQGGVQVSGAVAFFANKVMPAQSAAPAAAKPDEKTPSPAPAKK